MPTPQEHPAPPPAEHDLSRGAARRFAAIAVILAAGALLAWTGARGFAPAHLDRSHDLRAVLPERRIDLNAAPAHELRLLPGIGPAMSQRIVDDRHANGAYHTLEDLERVRGVGPRTILNISPYVAVTPPADDASD